MIIQKFKEVLQWFAKIRIISTSAATMLRLHMNLMWMQGGGPARYAMKYDKRWWRERPYSLYKIDISPLLWQRCDCKLGASWESNDCKPQNMRLLSLVTVYFGLSYTVTQRSMLKYDHRPTPNFSKFYSNFFHLFFKNRIIQNFVCFKRLNTKAVSYKIAKFILKNNFTRPIRIALQGTTYSGFLYVIVVTTSDFSTFFLKFSCYVITTPWLTSIWLFKMDL